MVAYTLYKKELFQAFSPLRLENRLSKHFHIQLDTLVERSKFKTVDHVAENLPINCYGFTIDLKSAYRSVAIHPDDKQFRVQVTYINNLISIWVFY